MKSYETSATVEDRGRVLLDGVPFATGTEVAVVISPKGSAAADAGTATGGESIEVARVRMRELFATVRGFRMTSSIRREELYDRHGLR